MYFEKKYLPAKYTKSTKKIKKLYFLFLIFVSFVCFAGKLSYFFGTLIFSAFGTISKIAGSFPGNSPSVSM